MYLPIWMVICTSILLLANAVMLYWQMKIIKGWEERYEFLWGMFVDHKLPLPDIVMPPIDEEKHIWN